MPNAEDNWALEDPDILLRRIARVGDVSMVVIDETSGEIRPRGGAFSFDDDGCSVYVERILHRKGLTATALVRAPQNAVISLPLGAVRAECLDATPDPWPSESDGHPRDAAHALITNPNGLGSKRRAKAASRLAKAASFVIEGR